MKHYTVNITFVLIAALAIIELMTALIQRSVMRRLPVQFTWPEVWQGRVRECLFFLVLILLIYWQVKGNI